MEIRHPIISLIARMLHNQSKSLEIKYTTKHLNQGKIQPAKWFDIEYTAP